MKTKKLKFALVFLILVTKIVFSYATKHVLYMQDVYNNTSYFCITSYPNDTVVIYELPYCSDPAITMWIVGDDIFYCDSLVYVPTGPGSVQITSNCGTPFSTFLNFYSTPPLSPTFEELSGDGYMNVSGDTVWMCSNSIFLGSYTDASDAVSFVWNGPGGFTSSSEDPITVTFPGRYYFTRENPCGITVDSVEVIALPTTLPSVFDDQVFCNQDVHAILDVGYGWNTYLWTYSYYEDSVVTIITDTATYDQIYCIPVTDTVGVTHTITITEAGKYILAVENVCVDNLVLDSLVVEHQEYELPNLAEYHETMCADSVIILDPGYMYNSYKWTLPDETTYSTPTLTVSGLTTGTGQYNLTVMQGSCVEYGGVFCQFYEQPQTPAICIVTVDPTMTKNKIVWTVESEPLEGDPIYSEIASYNVYRWTGGNNWNLLGNVSSSEEHVFIDLTSNPPQSPERYKITQLDNCGVESTKSYYHQTITLSSSLGSTSGEVSLLWTEYKDESNSFSVDMYEIWRGTSLNNLEYVTSTPFPVYNDIGISGQVYYQIVALREDGCDPSPFGAKNLVAGSFSNITNNVITTGVQNHFFLSEISLYPNPSAGIFSVRGKNISLVEVRDMRGSLLLTTTTTTDIDLSAYSSGLYVVTVNTDQGSTNLKCVIQ